MATAPAATASAAPATAGQPTSGAGNAHTIQVPTTASSNQGGVLPVARTEVTTRS